jgi:hypothetical protein
VVLLLLSSQSKSKVSKIKKNQRKKLIPRPAHPELTTAPCSSRMRPARPPRAHPAHHRALLVAHMSCPAAARVRLSPRSRTTRPAHARQSPRTTRPTRVPASACGSLTPCPRARLSRRPPRSTRVPASACGRLAPRPRASLSRRPPLPRAHVRPPQPTAVSHVPCSPPHERTRGCPRASAPIPASHASCSPPRERTRG